MPFKLLMSTDLAGERHCVVTAEEAGEAPAPKRRCDTKLQRIHDVDQPTEPPENQKNPEEQQDFKRLTAFCPGACRFCIIYPS
jgi:hypothetical protein